uniref:OTU domain-containing protein n=1 Tax=Panagrolaimus sp. ES5 TaxID=591445 RepID=A0AC34G0T1_9BILA
MFGFQIVDVVKDGNDFYRATLVAHEDDQDNHGDLRDATCRWIKENPKKYKNDISPMTIDDYIAIHSDQNIPVDNTEIEAVSDMIKTPFFIIQNDRDPMYINDTIIGCPLILIREMQRQHNGFRVHYKAIINNFPAPPINMPLEPIQDRHVKIIGVQRQRDICIGPFQYKDVKQLLNKEYSVREVLDDLRPFPTDIILQMLNNFYCYIYNNVALGGYAFFDILIAEDASQNDKLLQIMNYSIYDTNRLIVVLPHNMVFTLDFGSSQVTVYDPFTTGINATQRI